MYRITTKFLEDDELKIVEALTFETPCKKNAVITTKYKMASYKLIPDEPTFLNKKGGIYQLIGKVSQQVLVEIDIKRI